jgi:hypothetical protein
MKAIRALGMFAAAGLAAAAHAELVFSNISITGSLSTGATSMVSDTDIDFTFPDAIVGDPVDPRRFGNIVITFEVMSDAPIKADQLLLSVGGGLAGTGLIFFNEVVEDLNAPAILATHNVVLDENAALPYNALLDFAYPSDHIKVKKTLLLTAVPDDPQALDLAQVSLIEQGLILVPEPAGFVILLGGLAAALRRRGA